MTDTTSNQQVTRPLNVLVPLIKEDLQEAERAGVPYYRAAGEKMLEAKEQMRHGQFGPWLKRNFKLTDRAARHYMLLARDTQNGTAVPFSSQRAHRRHRSERRRRSTNGGRSTATSLPAPQVDRAEMAATKVLALKLVSAGYKVLAQEFHPDRGGSTEAMTRLNRVRTRLKLIIERE